jgi:hypothetical protein
MLEQTDTMEALPEESFQAVQLSGDMFGALINLSGRRRFTSQRVVLYAVLASMGHDGAIATARETLALFRDAHLTLVEGTQRSRRSPATPRARRPCSTSWCAAQRRSSVCSTG